MGAGWTSRRGAPARQVTDRVDQPDDDAVDARHCPGWWADRFLRRDRDEQHRAQLVAAIDTSVAQLQHASPRERVLEVAVLNERIDAYNAMTTAEQLERLDETAI